MNGKNFTRITEKSGKALLSGLLICGLVLLSDVAFAQNSAFHGKITDQQTGEALSNATLKFLNSTRVITTNAEGFYQVDAEAGQLVLIQAPGYQPKRIEVSANTASDMQDISLVRSSEFNNSDNFTDRLNLDQINSFGDYSIEEALVRLPGVMYSRDRNINIRGVGPEAYNLTIDGQQMAGTGAGSRSFDLGAISTDMISEVELIKVLRPDMYANALAGVVNLKTHKPVGDERTLKVRLGGGANSSYITRNGPSSRAQVNYAERFNEDFTLAVNISYQQDKDTREQLGIGYGTFDFGNGPVDVLERVAPALWVDERSRFGSSVEFQYQPTEDTRYFVRGLVNTDNRERVSHRDTKLANGDWVDQNTTGAEGELGAFRHDARQRNTNTEQYALRMGGEHVMDAYSLSYDLSYSRGRFNNKSYLFPFLFDEFNFDVDFSDRYHPTMAMTNQPTVVLEDGSVDRRFLIGQNFDRLDEEHVGNDYSANLDVEIPMEIGALKFGASSLISVKTGEYDENTFEYNRTLRMVSFNMLREPNRNIDLFDDVYRIPWLVNTSDARLFFETQRPLFTGNEDYRLYQSSIRNYDATEFLNSGYAMADLEFGMLRIVGGARVEYMSSEYEGNEILFDEDAEFLERDRVTESDTDLQLFPNAQLILEPDELSTVHLAYSKSIQRPDFYHLSPFERVNNQDSTVYRGNAKLDPVTSTNYDFMAERLITDEGAVSVGAFYKELDQFIVQQNRNLNSGELAGYRETSYRNGSETATIYGVEVSARQRLSFLPGAFGNLGVFANYTWSDSEYNFDRGETTRFPGQSEHVVNTALDYVQGRISAQISYHWTSESLSHLAGQMDRAPAVSNSEVYLDRYEDGAQLLSASFQYQLSDRFRFWANAYNLLKDEQVEYSYNRSYYPTSIYTRKGIELSLGLLYEF